MKRSLARLSTGLVMLVVTALLTGCDSAYPGPSEDAVYYFVLGDAADVSFSTCNAATPLDTVLYLRSDCDDPASQIVCNDNDPACFGGGPGASRITRRLSPGVYYLFVDGRAGPPVCGAFQVDITGL